MKNKTSNPKDQLITSIHKRKSFYISEEIASHNYNKLFILKKKVKIEINIKEPIDSKYINNM